jgi:hypothetical protein
MHGSGIGSPAFAAAPASCPGRSRWSRRHGPVRPLPLPLQRWAAHTSVSQVKPPWSPFKPPYFDRQRCRSPPSPRLPAPPRLPAGLERSVRQPAAAWPRSPRPNASSLPFSRPPPGAKLYLGGDHFQGADHSCPDGSRIALFLLACFFFGLSLTGRPLEPRIGSAARKQSTLPATINRRKITENLQD